MRCLKKGNMNEFQPLVSIVIPVYNGSNYMREAIDSALAQTYERVEVIVVNDGSTDDTEQIALSYGEQIRYFRKENGGVSSALNLGIKEMKGEYFSWLSHDDVYTPDKIEVQIDALRGLEEKNTLVLCKAEFINKNSEPIQRRRHVRALPCGEVLPWNTVLHHLLKNGSFNGCALLIPKTAFTVCGRFDERLRFNQDGFMWDKIFMSGFSLLCIPDVCVKNRIHNGQLTQRGQNIFHEDCEAMSVYLIPELKAITTKHDRFLFDYAKYNAKYGNRRVVKRVLSMPIDSFNWKERMSISTLCCYGFVRPMLRRLFYALQKI